MSDVDFFISYNHEDKAWSEWIAWQLEAAGFTTLLQAWDFRPGTNFVQQMQLAAERAKRTIAVLSPNYLAASFTQPEWQAAFAADPTGEQGILVPIRVSRCRLKGLLPQVVYIDLVGLGEDESRSALLNGVRRDRGKPEKPPVFPGGRSVFDRPVFPGPQSASDSPSFSSDSEEKAAGDIATAVGMQGIELLIDRDFDSYSRSEQDRILAAIRSLLELKGEIRVVQKRRGSVILTLELTPEEAERLYWAVRAGDLSEFGVMDAQLITLRKRQKRPLSKSQIIANISEITGLSKRQVNKVFEQLTAEIKKSLSSNGTGIFAIPGLVKIERKEIPARPARSGVPNPFKPGELMDQPAKPASVKVIVRALKNLKDMV